MTHVLDYTPDDVYTSLTEFFTKPYQNQPQNPSSPSLVKSCK